MKKFIISLVLIFLIFSSTTVVYSSFNKDDVYLDSTSDFYIATETLVTDDNKTLIPLNQVRGVNDVYYVEYQYDIIVKSNYDLHTVIEDLEFSQNNIPSATLRDVFNFDISTAVIETTSYNETLLGTNETVNMVTVTVTISMNEPSTEEQFNQLVGGYLTFESYFFVN